MCGIAGILDSKSVEAGLIGHMVGTITHRGPDHSATFSDGPVSLGYVRLGILDLSNSANQPMADVSGNYVAVYNGEVYNFPELRRELQAAGLVFRTTCDTEVVVNLFAARGVSGVQKLNGMFAFAVWSKRDRELWIFRDPIGVKPLYYAFDGNRLLFGSEVKALHVARKHGFGFSTQGVMNYLTYGHSVAPITIFEGVNKLLPGCYIHARPGHLSVSRYYEFPVPAKVSPRRSDNEWIEAARCVIDAAVRRQMIADVPVGVFLSGGIDSGLITAMMARHAGKIRTFTITYPGRARYDESADARLVASALGTHHHEVPFTEQDVPELLQKLAWHYDEPFGDAASVPVYLLSKAARQHVKVALSGEGGDEMFSGYRRYIAERSYAAYRFLPDPVRKAAIYAASFAGRARRLNRITQALAITDSAARYATWLQVFRPDALAWLLSDTYAAACTTYDPNAVYKRLYHESRDSHLLGRLYYIDAQTWLPDTYLEKVDKASMAVSLEVRVPLLDLEVVRFAATLPEHMRIRGTTTKYMLRRIARDMLPPGISRRPKRGLSVPTDPWFRGALNHYVRDILLDGRTHRRGWFRKEAVERLLSRHAEGHENCETQIWILLMFEIWCRAVADKYSEVGTLAAS